LARRKNKLPAGGVMGMLLVCHYSKCMLPNIFQVDSICPFACAMMKIKTHTTLHEEAQKSQGMAQRRKTGLLRWAGSSGCAKSETGTMAKRRSHASVNRIENKLKNAKNAKIRAIQA
jgi:hypothetical protein